MVVRGERGSGGLVVERKGVGCSPSEGGRGDGVTNAAILGGVDAAIDAAISTWWAYRLHNGPLLVYYVDGECSALCTG